ncbi:uncharacterized protein LOC144102295 [Amblyomma americanum]
MPTTKTESQTTSTHSTPTTSTTTTTTSTSTTSTTTTPTSTPTTSTTTTTTSTSTTSTTTTPTSTTTTKSTSTTSTTTTPTSTTTTKSTSTTTTTALPMSSPPLIPYPLVCTVTYQYEVVYGRTIYMDPPDGFCDLLFYDSLHRGGQNKLGDRYDAKLGHFFNLSRTMRVTGLGVSFINDASVINVQSYSPSFEPALVDLWNRGISHFGVINIYGNNTQQSVIIGVLKFLQKIYSIIRTKVTPQRPCYIVIGVQFDQPGSHEVMRYTTSIFKPSLYIAVTHKSYIQYDIPGCKILPTSFLDYPSHIDRSTIRNCISILEAMSHLNWTMSNNINISMAISFTLQNRVYMAVWNNPSNFEFFERCRNGTAYVSYGVCFNVGSYQYRPELEAVFEYRRTFYSTHTFENDQVLKAKICKAKAAYVTIPFGIAIFDIEHDTLWKDCPVIGIRKGNLTRSTTIRKLRNFVRDRFTNANQLQNCLAIV